jgi:AraC family transcriptional regulator
MYEEVANELSAAAAELTEAVSKARGGNAEAARTHLVQALALLRGLQSFRPRGAQISTNSEANIVRGGLAPWQMRKVIAFVESNLYRHIHVQELAKLLDLSASYFCRAFKRAFGASPSHYVIGRRIDAAKTMMLTTSEPLREIAVNCGMCDQQHFTRSFRRIVGETPSMWRKTRRGSLNGD